MKNIASHYGWIVLVTLIMAVMVALATPLGTFMGEVFVSSMNAAKQTLDKVTDDGVKNLNNQNNQFNELFASESYQEAGLYVIKDGYQVLDKSWSELAKNKTISVKLNEIEFIEQVTNEDGTDTGKTTVIYKSYHSLVTPYDETTKINASSDALDGHLVLKSDIVLLSANAFTNCDQLDCVTMKGVNVVQKDAFKDCDRLTTIIIDRPIMEGFEAGAINNCPNFNTIIFKGTFKQFKMIKFGEQNFAKPITLICTDRTLTMDFK